MNKYTVMPLLNSSFEPGKAREIVAGFEDMDVRNIAQAELFYFMGEAESSSEIAERYLTSEIMELRLSASMIYGYSVIRQIKRCRFHQIKTGLSEHLTMG